MARDDLTLWLAGPLASAAKPMPDGRVPQPGGWNRFVLQVADLGTLVATLRAQGVNFRNDIVAGPGGQQILCEDPIRQRGGTVREQDGYALHRHPVDRNECHVVRGRQSRATRRPRPPRSPCHRRRGWHSALAVDPAAPQVDATRRARRNCPSSSCAAGHAPQTPSLAECGHAPRCSAKCMATDPVPVSTTVSTGHTADISCATIALMWIKPRRDAGGGARTRTAKGQGVLSALCLPIPSRPRRRQATTAARGPWPAKLPVASRFRRMFLQSGMYR